MMISAIVGVLVLTGVLIVALWSVVKSTERAERDPRYRRTLFLIVGAIYAIGAIRGFLLVLVGNEPWWILLLLPVPIVLAIGWLRMAKKVRIDSNQ